MKTRVKLKQAGDRRRDERGAVLMMMLLVAVLLLAAGGALILSTAMSTSLAYDASGEVQAYYAAEAGIEDSLAALRGQFAPNPLVAPNVGATIADANKLSFRAAVTALNSNRPGEPAVNADGTPSYRLSRWLNYDFQSDPALGYNDRKIVDAPYALTRGTAYSVNVIDPDNSQNVLFWTTGYINGSTSPLNVAGTNPGDGVTITFNPRGATNLTAYPAINSTLGGFNVRYTGLGALIPSTPFQLQINQAAPWPGQFTITGKLEGLVTPLASTLAVTLNTATAVVQGTQYTVTANNPILLLTTVATGTVTNIPVSVTASDPRQLIIRSTGYGPKGARKRLEMVVDNFAFLINPPAPICIRGADNQASAMTFDLGSSNAKQYSGADASGVQPQQPTVAISLHDWTAADNGIKKGSTVANPQLSILDVTNPPSMQPDPNPVPVPWPAGLLPVPDNDPATPAPDVPKGSNTPDFLRTADAAREFLYGPTGDNGGLMAVAKSRGRYFSTFNGTAGDYNQGGLTFVDGDCTLDGGGGLLVVTGNLDLKGNAQFKGLILVMGAGRVTRSGGGNADIRGAWMIASFARTGPGNFLAPSFDVSGGGNADFQYDWNAIVGANRGIGLSIAGIAER